VVPAGEPRWRRQSRRSAGGLANERMALLLRDWFRSHPQVVPSYASFKRSLAAISPDVGTYSDVKDPVVDLVLAVAEPWADETGWVV
jgi:GrpB-like predicted nucleotidyltransferase (UPF0157 family)